MKQFTAPIAKAFAVTSFSALCVMAVAPAQAVVLDFESLAQNNNTGNDVGTSYTEDGFTVSQVGSQLYPFAVWGNQSNDYPGSTALYNNTANGVTRLTQVGGGAFTLSSIDLANIFSTTSPTPVTFTGLKADTTTITQNFTTNAIGLTTFNFANFTNLVSVDWTQASTAHQFDNINVSSSTAVPEPFTVLGTIFGAGYGVALKRKLAKAQADKQDIS
jgi:hypothetical protein